MIVNFREKTEDPRPIPAGEFVTCNTCETKNNLTSGMTYKPRSSAH